MFAGASRAFLTAIIFALETTDQAYALLPLLATCSASYIISYFLMENTIMTEKISRRGVKTPVSYEPDILEKITVEYVMERDSLILSEDNTIKETTDWLDKEPIYKSNYFIITSNAGEYKGILSASNLFSRHHAPETNVGKLIKRKHISVSSHDTLRRAVEIMANENVDVLPVLSPSDNVVTGMVSYKNILSSYKISIEEHVKDHPTISLKRRSLKILVHGQKLIRSFKKKY
jgi:predicted transcriptional regulator